jgi:hypothetical protein
VGRLQVHKARRRVYFKPMKKIVFSTNENEDIFEPMKTSAFLINENEGILELMEKEGIFNQ